MRAVAYLRCSTAGQAENGVSLDVQRERIEEYCRYKALEIVETIVDEGVSGGVNANRNGFVQLLDRIDDNGIQAVVLYSLERLSRDMLTLLALERYLEENDVELHTVEGLIGTETPDGFMAFAIRAFSGEIERRQVKYRTRRALQHMKAQGQVVGRVPYGWRREGNQLVEVPAEQGVIALANRLYRKGLKLAEVVRRIAKTGYRSRSGRPFTAQQVKRMIEGYVDTRAKKRSRLGKEIRDFVLAIA